jgi:hypothetical protein
MAARPEHSPAEPELIEQGECWEHWQCGRTRWWIIRFRDGSYGRNRDRLERQLRRGCEPIVFVISRLKDLDSISLSGFLLCAESSSRTGRLIGLVGRQAAVKLKLVLKMMSISPPNLREFPCIEAAETAIIRQGRASSANRGRE